MAEQQVRAFAQERDQAQHKLMVAEEQLERVQKESEKLRLDLQRQGEEIAKEKERRAEAEAQAQQRQAEQAERIDALLQRLENVEPEDPDSHPLTRKDPNS